MPAYRFFLDSNLATGDQVELCGNEGRHAALVMRRDKNDSIELINGRGALAKGLISDRNSLGISVNIVEVKNVEPKPFELNLMQMMPRWETLCWIVEKCTELGISNLMIISPCTEKIKITPQRLQRLQLIMISALKQSGELFIPNLKITSENELTRLNQKEHNFFADYVGKPINSHLAKDCANHCTLRVGPEGGFSSVQKDLMIQAGVQAVNLHFNTLRAETAAICGLFYMQAFLQISTPKTKD